MFVRRDILLDIANVPGLPAAREEKLYRGGICGVVEVVCALYGRVSDTAKVHQSPRHSAGLVTCMATRLL